MLKAKTKIPLILLLFTMWALPAHAQTKPIPYQGSAAAESAHLFIGTTIIDLSVSWNASASNRYLMIFDSNSTSTHNTTPCSVTQVNGCLLYCYFIPTSDTAPDALAWDWVMHPITAQNGIVAGLSTGAGCGTYTADSANNWFYAQLTF